MLQWRNVTPFGIRQANQFRAEPPPALTSRRYTKSFNEVKTVGSANSTERPQDRRTRAAVCGNRRAGGMEHRGRQVLDAERASLSERARTLALVNMAISDGGVAVFDTKYHYTLWRPETAIHFADLDDNPRTEADPSFTPFITTPCFPSYPSAHGTLSSAARRSAERLYGRRHRSIVISSPALGITLTYRTLRRSRSISQTLGCTAAFISGSIRRRAQSKVARLATDIYQHYLRRHGSDWDRNSI